jgi:hypothetical protein
MFAMLNTDVNKSAGYQSRHGLLSERLRSEAILNSTNLGQEALAPRKE